MAFETDSELTPVELNEILWSSLKPITIPCHLQNFFQIANHFHRFETDSEVTRVGAGATCLSLVVVQVRVSFIAGDAFPAHSTFATVDGGSGVAERPSSEKRAECERSCCWDDGQTFHQTALSVLLSNYSDCDCSACACRQYFAPCRDGR
jgi:hypothetical protein